VLVRDVGASLSLTSTAPNGIYYVRVRARNASGTGPASNEVIVRVGIACTAPPNAPGTLTVSVSGFTVALAWGIAAGDPTTYLVEAGTAAGASNVATVDLGGLPLQLTTQAPAGTYYARTRARNACGTSPPSNEVSFTVGTPCVLPSAPGSLTASVAGSVVTLTWTAPPGSILSYVVEAGSISGASNLATVDTGSPQATLTATAAPGAYFVRVRGRNSCGIGAASSEIVVTVR
jgi:predicted phage tail protein